MRAGCVCWRCPAAATRSAIGPRSSSSTTRCWRFLSASWVASVRDADAIAQRGGAAGGHGHAEAQREGIEFARWQAGIHHLPASPDRFAHLDRDGAVAVVAQRNGEGGLVDALAQPAK